MSNAYRKGIADFLSEYLDISDCKVGYDDDRVIEQGIRILIKEGIFTAEELQKEVLRRYSALIPLYFINQCVFGKAVAHD